MVSRYTYLIMTAIFLIMSYLLLMHVRGDPPAMAGAAFFRNSAMEHVKSIKYIKAHITTSDCDNVIEPLKKLREIVATEGNRERTRALLEGISQIPQKGDVQEALMDVLVSLELIVRSPSKYDTHLAKHLIDEIYSKMCGRVLVSLSADPPKDVAVVKKAVVVATPKKVMDEDFSRGTEHMTSTTTAPRIKTGILRGRAVPWYGGESLRNDYNLVDQSLL